MVVGVVVLIGGPLIADPVLRADVFEDSAVLFGLSWAPMLAGGLLAWLLVRTWGRRDDLDRRVRLAMGGHPLDQETAWQFFLVGCFVLSIMLLSQVFSFYGAEVGTSPDLAVSASLVSRLLFLLAIPLVLMDRSGIVLDGRGTAMPKVALKVGEPWRWLGLIPVAVVVGMMGYLLLPHIGLPAPSMTLYGMLVAFAVIAVCEEIFFRAMVQTRLEILMGRWGGIGAASLLFAMTYALIQPFDAVAQLPGDDLVHNTGLAMLTYFPAGLFYGYLWACFRNTWLNLLMRMAMFVLLLPPDLQIGL
ncbi:CPBP family intramembrane glutamic endopeptidase [Nocardiopsis alkaliphila]|uniref:CPBP family intramembrane glutamic endopeptidase n=1 Tax=Nocardiopsis alkaliphila TaxID=225762 RepID=UPI000382887F|nr:CPBP family intramembrane glutamic endopeptidase [Nocardiopsis alkaliphila]